MPAIRTLAYRQKCWELHKTMLQQVRTYTSCCCTSRRYTRHSSLWPRHTMTLCLPMHVVLMDTSFISPVFASLMHWPRAIHRIAIRTFDLFQDMQISGKKKQHKHKLFGPDFPRTFLTLTPGCPGVKKFLPITGAAEKRTFWCGRPRFSARTSMTRRVLKKLCTKKVCVAFLAPKIHTPKKLRDLLSMGTEAGLLRHLMADRSARRLPSRSPGASSSPCGAPA